MDLVTRTICIEPGKSRLPGLLPYIGGENGSIYGNYGEYIYNIDLSKLADDDSYSSLASIGVLSYRSLIERYHWMEKFFSKCTYYQPIIKNNNVKWTILPNYTAEEQYCANILNDDLAEKVFRLGYTIYDMQFLANSGEISTVLAEYNTICGIMEDESETEYTYAKFMSYGGLVYYKFVEEAIGKIIIPEEIEGSLVPNFIFLTDISDFLADMKKLKAGEVSCNLNRYNAMGGDAIVEYLANFDENYITKQLEYFSALKESVPSINIQLSINVKYDDMGIMQLTTSDFIPGYYYKSGDTVFYNEETYICRKNIDDSNYAESSDITNGSYWLRKASVDGISQEMINYTGESLLRGLRVFKRSYSDYGDELPGIICNGSSKLELPYREGLVKNPFTVYNTYGDMALSGVFADEIYNIERDETNMTYRFQYVIHGKMNVNNLGEYSYDIAGQTGVLYDETYSFVISSITATVDGVEQTFTYDYIDFDSYEVNVDSVGKGVILSNMSHLNNSIFGESIYNGANQTYSGVFRDERDFGLSEKKIWNISNLEIDRGSNSAFEKHFRLFDVNSMEDVENYQNNFFNLED